MYELRVYCIAVLFMVMAVTDSAGLYKEELLVTEDSMV